MDVSFENLNKHESLLSDIQILQVLVAHIECVVGLAASNHDDQEANHVHHLDQLRDFVLETKKADVIEMLLQLKVRGQCLQRTACENNWPILHHCTKEGIVRPSLLRPESLEQQVNSLDKDRKTPIFYAETSEIVEMILNTEIDGTTLEQEGRTLIHEFFRKGILTLEILSKISCINNKICAKALHSACEEENTELVKMLLTIPKMIDEETHDGLTGFAISLLNQNTDIVMAFLNSGIASHSRNVFLASEFCKLTSVENTHLQSSLRQFLSTHEADINGTLCIVAKERDERLELKRVTKNTLNYSLYVIPVWLA